jgi:hypothetical protein
VTVQLIGISARGEGHPAESDETQTDASIHALEMLEALGALVYGKTRGACWSRSEIDHAARQRGVADWMMRVNLETVVRKSDGTHDPPRGRSLIDAAYKAHRIRGQAPSCAMP